MRGNTNGVTSKFTSYPLQTLLRGKWLNSKLCQKILYPVQGRYAKAYMIICINIKGGGM